LRRWKAKHRSTHFLPAGKSTGHLAKLLPRLL